MASLKYIGLENNTSNLLMISFFDVKKTISSRNPGKASQNLPWKNEVDGSVMTGLFSVGLKLLFFSKVLIFLGEDPFFFMHICPTRGTRRINVVIMGSNPREQNIHIRLRMKAITLMINIIVAFLFFMQFFILLITFEISGFAEARSAVAKSAPLSGYVLLFKTPFLVPAISLVLFL